MSKDRIFVLIISIFFLLISGCGGGGSGSGLSRYTVGGTIIGLTGTLVIQNNGGDDYTATADGSFTFSSALADGAAYMVSIITTPTNMVCNITNGTGTVNGANITTIIISCHDSSTYSVGGTVSNLSGTVVLQNNGGDDLGVTTSGSFAFTTALDDGDAYSVTIYTQPTSQTCYISNNSGTIATASVTDVTVTCFDSGSLDTTFGTNGVVTYDGGYDDVGYGVTTDSSGRVLVTGYVDDDVTPGQGKDIAVWRYDSSGSIDTTFGTNGVVTYHGGYRHDWGNSIVADSSDWVTACGQINPGGSTINMIILRYNSDGDPDTTFGTNGVVTYTVSGTDVCTRLRIDDNNKVVANGYTGYDMTIWRYQEDGSLDSPFGTGGLVQDTTSAIFEKYSFVFDSGDNINVSGPDSNPGMTIWRYGPTGTASTNFGTNGKTSYTSGTSQMSRAIGLDSSESIFTAGYLQPTGATTYSMAVWKYTAGGDLDSTFGDGGVALYSGTAITNEAEAMVIDSSGQPITTGYDSVSDLYVWKVTTGGELDSGFGTDGAITYDGGTADAGYDIALDSEGRILVTGSSSNGTDLDMLILRLHP